MAFLVYFTKYKFKNNSRSRHKISLNTSMLPIEAPYEDKLPTPAQGAQRPLDTICWQCAIFFSFTYLYMRKHSTLNLTF